MNFSSLIRWIYCLPISWMLIFSGFGSLAFFRLRGALLPRRLWKVFCVLCLLIWVAVVLQATLLGRSPEPASPVPEPLFQSYRKLLNGDNGEIFRSNLMNIFLFFPAGLLLSQLMPRVRHPWLCCAGATAMLVLFSLGIEYLQYHCNLGRAEADDVLHNGLGAFLGALLAHLNFQNVRNE